MVRSSTGRRHTRCAHSRTRAARTALQHRAATGIRVLRIGTEAQIF
jgi:hypothetical protein